MNIKNISGNHICTACGACALVCPKQAVTLEETPAGFLAAQVSDACVDCGLCRKVCPSVAENTAKYAPEDLLHGPCLAAFTGYATDPALRQNGQSGGLVTALLCYLLEDKQIDGAVVTGFNADRSRPVARIARTREEVLSCAGSYYAQCPTLPVLAGKHERLAAVTLGCQTDALTLLKEHRPELVPELTIGLVCAGQNSGRMIDDICQQANTDRPDAFRFRDKSPGGWPGEITLRKHGQTSTLPNAYRHSIKPVYECHRCLACFDQMNVNADLVCGDPWGLEEHLGPEGCTAVLARTEQGLRLLVQAQIAGLVHLDQLTPQEIFRGQTVDTRHSDKVYTAKTVFQSEGWLYPYDPEVIGDRPYTSKVMEKNRKTLLYTRKYAQAPTAQAAAEIAQRKKDKKLPLTARLKKLFK